MPDSKLVLLILWAVAGLIATLGLVWHLGVRFPRVGALTRATTDQKDLWDLMNRRLDALYFGMFKLVMLLYVTQRVAVLTILPGEPLTEHWAEVALFIVIATLPLTHDIHIGIRWGRRLKLPSV